MSYLKGLSSGKPRDSHPHQEVTLNSERAKRAKRWRNDDRKLLGYVTLAILVISGVLAAIVAF
jgi:hypothetical protein